MSALLVKASAIAFVSAIAFSLFLVGTSFPLDVRVRGDAYGYLKIAEGFGGFASAFTYSGDRTAGLPFFEYALHQAISVFSPTVYLRTWINTIGVAMLSIHIAAAWLFSGWARGVGLLKSDAARFLLFFFLATCPALVGHTTSPLSDTLAMDFILLGLVTLTNALNTQRIYTCLLYSGVAAVCFGYSVLVRPASILGLGVALIVCCAMSCFASRMYKLAFGTALLGCVIVLAPGSLSCSQAYGTLCLQSPKTFNASLSMQDGLRGARLMWSQKNEFPGTLPMVKDETMYNEYFQQCHIESAIGLADTALTGCLLARPLTLPAFVIKKWIGLFDYFRFTPYMENLTPPWLVYLSRAYGALAWLGLSLSLAMLFSLRKKSVRSNLGTLLISNTGVVLLVTYSVVMLAQHTALHTEERYGFPLIPLCAAMLIWHCEHSIEQYRTDHRFSPIASVLFCTLSLILFTAQIIAWDKVSNVLAG